MKPIAVINQAKLLASDIDQPVKLHKEGYVVLFVNEGPAIMFHQAAPDRRERIATAVMAGLCAREGLSYKNYPHMAFMAVDAAKALAEELDK